MNSDGKMAAWRDLLIDARTAAPELLGCVLVREHRGVRRAGIIVETEAYPHDDPACHGFRGRTRRNDVMFGRAGRAYVYRIHRSHCFNVVTGPEGCGEGVLVRALEPVEGIAAMSRARRRATVGAATPSGVAIANGPGKLCQALGIDLTLDGVELLGGVESLDRNASSRLYLLPRSFDPVIGISARIGISRARDERLRFYVEANRFVSR